MLSRGVPFGFFFCYLFGSMWSSEGEVGLRELGGSRLPSSPLFFLLPCLRLRLFHLLGFVLALLFKAHAEAVEVAGRGNSVSLS